MVCVACCSCGNCRENELGLNSFGLVVPTSLGDFLSKPKSAIESATMRTTRHSSVGEQQPTDPASHHHTTSPSAQQATKPSRLHPLPHPEGYANSNYLPLRVDWVTYLNWFSRWGSCGKLPHLTAPSPAHTVLLGLSVLGPWLVSRTQHSQMSQSAFHCSLSWRIYDGYFTQNRLPQSGLSARIQIARERAKTPVRSIINIALLLSSGYDVP